MSNPTEKYRLSLLVTSAAILLLMVSGGIVWRLREPELLTGARKVADVSTWWRDADSVDTQFMAWTTDTQLFAMGNTPGPENSGDATDLQPLPFLYDTRNHRRTDLTKLASLIDSTNASNAKFDVAPDGRHIAWITDSPDKVEVSRLDGSDRKTWRVSNPTDVAWERDSTHWKALCWRSTPNQSVMTTASIDSPGAVTMPETHEANDLASLTGVHDELANEFEVDVVGDQVVSAASGMRAQAHTIKLTAPEGTTINDLIVSPDGRFIAWELQSLKRRDVFGKANLPWLDRFFGPTVRHRMELWVSKADGTDMHELGYCPLAAEAEDDSGPKLILWQPDSKQMSFVYKGLLYVVGGE